MGNNIQEIIYSELQSYNDIIQYLNKKNRTKHLLLGNGFSMAYDYKIFSYNALADFIQKLDNANLKKLFEVINSRNFELIMRNLDSFQEFAKAFEFDLEHINLIKKAQTDLQDSLIKAVTSLHPEHVFSIPDEKGKKCASFLSEYFVDGGNIFSTNYDLLLYWVTMKYEIQDAIDGFGRELLNPNEIKKGEEPEWSELFWGKHREDQRLYYLHGALPFFDTGIEIEKEEYDEKHYLLENIKERMQRKEYPIFVTAGNGNDKLEQIMHNKYLTYSYDSFSKIEGSLISFGFNFGEYDDHIIEAINKASKFNPETKSKLYSIYIGVYSEHDLEHIKSIENKFKCKVNVYNSKSAHIWV